MANQTNFAVSPPLTETPAFIKSEDQLGDPDEAKKPLKVIVKTVSLKHNSSIDLG